MFNQQQREKTFQSHDIRLTVARMSNATALPACVLAVTSRGRSLNVASSCIAAFSALLRSLLSLVRNERSRKRASFRSSFQDSLLQHERIEEAKEPKQAVVVDCKQAAGGKT
jgi:hypothetical protein